MTLLTNITSYQVVELPDDKYFFVGELPGELLLFQNVGTNGKLTLTEPQFLTMLDNGEARLINPPGRETPTGSDPYIFSPIVPPGTSEAKLRKLSCFRNISY